MHYIINAHHQLTTYKAGEMLSLERCHCLSSCHACLPNYHRMRVLFPHSPHSLSPRTANSQTPTIYRRGIDFDCRQIDRRECMMVDGPTPGHAADGTSPLFGFLRPYLVDSGVDCHSNWRGKAGPWDKPQHKHATQADGTSGP
ncbi:hypothetical protein VTK56DRAFT_5101 [Thermocarpiscus australiensis]